MTFCARQGLTRNQITAQAGQAKACLIGELSRGGVVHSFRIVCTASSIVGQAPDFTCSWDLAQEDCKVAELVRVRIAANGKQTEFSRIRLRKCDFAISLGFCCGSSTARRSRNQSRRRANEQKAAKTAKIGRGMAIILILFASFATFCSIWLESWHGRDSLSKFAWAGGGLERLYDGAAALHPEALTRLNKWVKVLQQSGRFLHVAGISRVFHNVLSFIRIGLVIVELAGFGRHRISSRAIRCNENDRCGSSSPLRRVPAANLGRNKRGEDAA